jgi:hypothetical protein
MSSVETIRCYVQIQQLNCNNLSRINFKIKNAIEMWNNESTFIYDDEKLDYILKQAAFGKKITNDYAKWAQQIQLAENVSNIN